MSMTWSAGTTFSIERAGTFALGGAADAAGIAAVGAFLIADVAGVALSQPQLVSREMAEHYAALEAHNLALIKEAKANGLPVALPTPSPFSDQAWVNSLPTQSQIDQRTAFPESRDAPNPIPGTAPLEAPSVAAHGVRGEYDHRQNGTPGFARHEREIGDDFSDAKRYPYVNTYELKTEAGAQARTFLNNCDNDPNDSRKSFDTLKSVLKNIDPTPPGWDAHHIVEQSQTEKFGTEAIQNPNNIINIDSAVHRAITQEYNSAPGGGSDADKYAKAHPGEQISRVRDYVKFLSYSEQRQVGLNAIQRALENPRVQIPEADRARMERDIERLRNVGRETPSRDDPNGCPEPPYSRVQGILSRLSDAGSRSQLTMANKTPEQTIQWAELAKRIRDNISGPTESKLNIRIPSPINVLERGKSGSVTDLAPVLGRVVGVEGKYLMFEKINGERIGLDLINTLAASKNIAATYAFLQNAYEKGHPVQIAMTNAQDLSVMHVSALQLDQGRGQSRFDEYRGR